jgi:hypothetical protein
MRHFLMKLPGRNTPPFISLFAISLLLFSSSLAIAAQAIAVDVAWLPVTEAERNMKAPVVEKDSGVEALFWRIHVMDEVLGGQDLQRVLYHYVRLKVFDEKGKAKAATIDIPFGDKNSILYVSGRTIKADGTELELQKESVYERTLVKSGRSRQKVKSFAMPGVEPGAIVEYRWKEIRHDPNSLYMRLQFQREFPAQKVTYFVKPLSRDYTSYSMSIWPVNCKPSPMVLDNEGFNLTTLENVPAFREEPMMPGEANVRPWALIFYSDGRRREPEKYWNDVGKEIYNDVLKPALKANDDIKQAAAQAVQGAASDEEKVLALIRYLRRNLRDLFGPQVTEAERSKILKQMPGSRVRTSAEVFKSGVGTADELNTLFAAMASQVGLDTRPALVADREDIAFQPQMTERYFLRSIDMAVNIGGKWKLYDVSARRLPSNMLSWREEGMKALLSDPKKPVFVESPLSPPEASASVRTAKFTLADDGTLEGDVDQQYTGHTASARRNELVGETEARQFDQLKEEITKVFPGSEFSAPRIENVDDPDHPLKVHYHIKIQGYAQRTGKRLLLQPLFFQRGESPMFASSERQYPLDFHYGWKEHDEVSIAFPQGFSLDNADNPGPLRFGEPGSYDLSMSMVKSRELVCVRTLIFGNKGSVYYPANLYPQIKAIFDEIHSRDNHTISLKQGAAAGGQ